MRPTATPGHLSAAPELGRWRDTRCQRRAQHRAIAAMRPLWSSEICGASNPVLDELGRQTLIMEHLRPDAPAFAHETIQNMPDVDPRLPKRPGRFAGVRECLFGARRKRPVPI